MLLKGNTEVAERFSFTPSVCVRVYVRVRTREAKMPSRRIPKHKELDVPSLPLPPSLFFGFGGGEGGRVEREREVKAVLIETWPNQTHYHFYQFAPPKMLIR